VEHPVVDDSEGLLYLANQGTVVFHVWTSRAPHVERPDRMIFDLDPPEGDVAAARRAARTVRALLDDLGLPSFVMCTGSKGYHVVVPLRPEAPIDQVGAVAEALAQEAVARDPNRLTTEFRIAKRKGRVFMDWLRNRYAQSAVCPWSLRAKPRAPVATPIAWDELSRTRPDRWRLDNLGPRLAAGDPWADIDRSAVGWKRVEKALAGLSAERDRSSR
jgi:bifunctional non-homologous end joining protein LigD